MIVITGAAGFIGSVLVSELNRRGYQDLVVVDKFGRQDRVNNLAGKVFSHSVERQNLEPFLRSNAQEIEAIFHIGARTDTSEQNWELFQELNLKPSKMIWNFCAEYQIPMIYASSAATYGSGTEGYNDTHQDLDKLVPLNPYGLSKHQFDQWALSQEQAPPFWAGLKFFNVYGPNEYHKGRMASVIFHAFNQIKANGKMKLFRSHKAGIENGHQARDFVYVKDLVDMLLWLNDHKPTSGLYNIGTGQARTFLDLVKNVFKALEQEEQISFIDTPADIRENYQYFTQAEMGKIRELGYDKPFTSLEEGVQEYVDLYLKEHVYF